VLGRWLQPVAVEVTPTSLGVRGMPSGATLLESKRGRAAADHPGNILVAMHAATEGAPPAERVHRGHYIVADPECCALVGNVPLAAITSYFR
jgi:hypothetical protein